MGVLRFNQRDIAGLTLREFLIIYDSYLISSWDHTAQTGYLVGVLTSAVIGIASKHSVKPQPMTYYHPYRKTVKTGHRITTENFEVLRMVGDAVVAGK